MQRDPVLEAERHQTNDHRRPLGVAPNVVYQVMPQIVDAEVGGVDDDVGPGTQSRESLSLPCDCSLQVPRPRKRVGPPGLAEAPNQNLVRAVEEDHLHVMPGRFEVC